MERINIPASLNNLTTINKVQQKEALTSLNAGLQQQETVEKKEAEKSQKPNEAEEAEGKTVDPDDRRKEKKDKEKKKKRKNKDPKHINRGRSSGKFIDFSA